MILFSWSLAGWCNRIDIRVQSWNGIFLLVNHILTITMKEKKLNKRDLLESTSPWILDINFFLSIKIMSIKMYVHFALSALEPIFTWFGHAVPIRVDLKQWLIYELPTKSLFKFVVYLMFCYGCSRNWAVKLLVSWVYERRS